MRNGFGVGISADMEVTVTPDMFASFNGELVHPVYSTVSMVYHMEWVSRQTILSHLKDHEEGMGGAVAIKHVAPCMEGDIIKFTATVTSYRKDTVITKVRAECQGTLVGHGEVKQVILRKDKIASFIDRKN
ncbi:thioesterase family protein [Bacillus massilinigeriensis]|uniref:thioesterase family protein n=1 Tax=Bacillus mediterraneensis TaxID=1805474 RepID=UPI0008F86866|nr:thioesterase [Bacillus mediterraneensis]